MKDDLSDLYTTGINYEKLTDEQKKFFDKWVWNGVGSNSYVIDPPDLIFKYPSKVHDLFFFAGGNDERRKLADKDFLKRCLEVSKKKKLWIKRYYFIGISYIYYVALVLLSKKAWEYYDQPAETWEEVIERVKAYYIREGKSVPWFTNTARKLLGKRNSRIKSLQFLF